MQDATPKSANCEETPPVRREFRPAEIPYDEAKFKELILYIAEKAEDDPTFGDLKLNKVLYYSDFFAYAMYGKPITGAVYQKLRLGPAPRRLLPARAQLVQEGRANVVTKGRQFTTTITIARKPPKVRMFATAELDLVDEVFEMLRGVSATAVSNFSHDESAGWQLVARGETIPYESVFISTEKPRQLAFERGRELATQYGW